MLNGVIFAILSLHNAGGLIIKFPLKRIYGLEEDVGWKIPRCLFRAWPSLMSEWDHICCICVSILL